jgi:hypothetical protein
MLRVWFLTSNLFGIRKECPVALFSNYMVVQMVRGDLATRAHTYVKYVTHVMQDHAQDNAQARKPNAMHCVLQEVAV